MPDPYETLGVARTATQEEIKKAFRSLARQHHPDANREDPTAEERFKEINAAYEVLSDPEKRQRYDMFGDDRAQGGAGFGDFGGFGDLFATFFGGMGGSRSQRGPGRGHDVVAEVEITLEDAAVGVQRSVDVETLVECPECHGTRAATGTHPETCSNCAGAGEVRQVRRTMFGDVMTAAPCPRCRGVGEVIPHPCQNCDGHGRVASIESLTLEIPEGIEDGAQLRVHGRGEAGTRGGRAGDLYVVIHVAPHDTFKRAGEDLGCEVHVPMTIAALGGDVAVPTLDGPEMVEVKPGTQTGEVVRLKGKGMPRLGRHSRGELVGLLRVQTPTDLDDEQEALLRTLAEKRGETVAERGLFDRIREAFR
jgi:molecular chaperone DnaJ